jgi:hypothetical protein
MGVPEDFFKLPALRIHPATNVVSSRLCLRGPFEQKSSKFYYNISYSLQAHPPSVAIILNNSKKSGLIQEASFLHPGR